MYYYVFETAIKPDGGVSFSAPKANSTFAEGLSYYYGRASAMAANATYAESHLMLTDEKLTILKQDDIHTAYVASEATDEANEATE